MTHLKDRLNEELHHRVTKKMAVLFTDVQGSTAFFKVHGDVAGRTMLQNHNDLLFPIVEKQGGVIIKTIGDSIMASFDDPGMAVKSAVEMQKRLFSYNQKRPKKEQIHIRIGINFGDAIVEDDDIFGDVVNITSKILSVVKPDHIFVSQSIYDATNKSWGGSFLAVDKVPNVEGQGKIKVYEVLWREHGAEVPPPSVLSLRVVADGYARGRGKDWVEKWGEKCFDLAIPVIYKSTNRLTAKSSLELLSIFEDPITPAEVAREVLEVVRNHNSGISGDGAIAFQVFINTGDRVEQEKKENRIETDIDKIADAKKDFDDVLQSNKIYVTEYAYNFLKHFDRIEGTPAARTTKGKADLYEIGWVEPKKKQKKHLFEFRRQLEGGNHPKCFYCGSRQHPIGHCPSRTIWNSLNKLSDLGCLSFRNINTLFAEGIHSIIQSKDPTDQEEYMGQRSGYSDLAFDAFYELSSPFQLHFVKKIWLSKAGHWSEIGKKPTDKSGGGNLWLGLDCIRVSKLDQAEKMLETEVRRHGNDHRVHTALGLVHIERGDLTQALDYFETAMGCTNNKLQRSYISLLAFRVCEVSGRLNEAMQRIREALAIAPDCLEAGYRDTVLLIRRGEYRRGVDKLKRIIEKDPSYYVKALLDPDLAVVEDQIDIFLFELFLNVKNEAMKKKPKAEETVEELKEWFGVADEKYRNSKADIEKIYKNIESNSFIGFTNAASLEENILHRAKMMLKNHKNRARRTRSVLITKLQKSLSYIKNHTYRKRLGELSLTIKRISDELSIAERRGKIITTPEDFKEARKTIERLSLYLEKLEPVIKKLRRLEMIGFIINASKRISLFVIGGLIIGSILFPLTTYYIAYFFSDFDYAVIARLWEYQKLAVFVGMAMGFITGVVIIVKNLFKNKG